MTDPITIPCYPAIGINGWTITITPDLARRIVALAGIRVCDIEDDLAAETDAKNRALTCAANYAEEVEELKSDLAAITARCDTATARIRELEKELAAEKERADAEYASRQEAEQAVSEWNEVAMGARDAADAATAQRDRLAVLLRKGKRNMSDEQMQEWQMQTDAALAEQEKNK